MILGYILHLIKIMPISDGMYYSIAPLLAAGLALGGLKTLAGGIQALASGRRRAEPKYEIPQEVFDVTQRALEAERTGMPEASRMMALQGAQQSALFGMRAAQDRRGGLASLGNIQAGLDRSNLAVAAQDAAMRQQNMIRAQQALMTQAGYRDKEFANRWQSWMNREQQRRANLGAGLQNIMGGFDLAGSIIGMTGFGGGGGNFGGTNLIPVSSGISSRPISGMSAVIGGFGGSVPGATPFRASIGMPGSQSLTPRIP